ncbi:Protein Shroom2 [Chelonia mydas]|uniref:Protein Shroom2 n=1 Tax=Chelonia mydas TaxID=8469 RepID=M7AZA1_CHEMY|nr:Protein Shroom2 [Chelonia mydas]
MDSWDHTLQTSQYGRLSSAKSNNSIDHVGNQSKRDSAYGSFSTSSSTPDHTLSNVDAASTDNMLYKVGHWDTAKHGNSKTGQLVNDNSGLEDKPGYLPLPIQYETSKSPRLEEQPDSKLSGSGRSSFGPIWHVPDKKSSSPPPPPPPLRSDSFAITKGHEKAHGSVYSEGASTQHFTVLNQSQHRRDWSSETAEQPRRPVRASDRSTDGKRINNSNYKSDISLDYNLSSAGDRYNNNSGNANRLQSSLSSTDVRFAQPAYGYHHQRQYSDESTFFHHARASTSPKEQRHISSYSGNKELPANHFHCYSPNQARMLKASANNGAAEQKVDNTRQSRYYCVTAKQPAQGSSRPLQLKDECWKPGIGADVSPGPHENPAIVTMVQKPKYYLPQQPVEPLLEEREKSGHYVMDREDGECISSKTDTDEQNYTLRQADTGFPEDNLGEQRAQLDQNLGHKWKASVRPFHTREPIVLSQESRGRSGTLPSDYRYSQENVNEKSKDCSLPLLTYSEPQTLQESHSCPLQGRGEESQWTELTLLNKRRGPAPQRPPPPKRDNKYRGQDNSTSLSTSSESLLAVPSKPIQSISPSSGEVITGYTQSPSAFNGKLKSAHPQGLQQTASTENVCQHLEEKAHLKSEPVLSSKYRYLQKPGMETSRSPSPQFAPQKLTDKPPVSVQDENPARYCAFTIMCLLEAPPPC